MRKLFIELLMKEARENNRIWLLTADLGYSVLEPFEKEFPDRFLNVGVAEQNAVGIASGLALCGKIPYVYSIIPFVTSRPYEQIKIDCAYMNTNVRLVGVGAGFSYGAAGATHHAIDDINIMRGLPNMSVVAPGSLTEAESLIKYSFLHQGPMYIRLDKKVEGQDFSYPVKFGKFSVLQEGKQCAVIATSSMLPHAFNAVEKLKQKGYSVLLLSAHTIKPFDKEKTLELIDRNIPIISIEEHNIIGGLCSAVSEVIAQSGKAAKFLPIGVKDEFSHYIGSQNYIKKCMGLCDLEEKIEDFINA